MLGELYDMIGKTLLVCGGIGLVLGINKGILDTFRRNIVQSQIQESDGKYTVEVEFTDPMLISEIQTLKQLQEVYNAQILQQSEKREILESKYDDIIAQINDQHKQMHYASEIGEIKISRGLYESKIAELSESGNNTMGMILRVDEKILKLTKQSDGITAKLNKIAMTEYKHQNQ